MTVAELVRYLQELGIEAQDLPLVRGDTDWDFVNIVLPPHVLLAENYERDGHGWTIGLDEWRDPDAKYRKVVKLS